MIEFLTKQDIVIINKRTCDRHRGNFVGEFNFLNEENLDYLIEAVSLKMFGSEMYPTIDKKAGLYMFNIISNHIFSDGNKRTGQEAALLFLELNGFEISYTTSNTDIFNFTIQVASGELTLEQT